ncbi:hypothetical protein GJV04_06255 [Enterobacteriaceae bacterium RIT714]|nr:hypothetical protein [Enterobacteriaceae bacterium RIT714]
MTHTLKHISIIMLTMALSTACTPRKNKMEPSRSGPFSYCVSEASSLVKINRAKYEKDYTNLVAMIKITKDYSGAIHHIRNDSQSIITPLYQYKINNICNEISQKLLAEMKDKALEIQSR